MDMKKYTDGTRTIFATAVMYERLYKSQGFKPVKAGGNVDKGRSNRNDKPENPVDSTPKSTDE